jgi:hypothetical protein
MRWPASTRFVIVFVRPIVMPARPNQNNNQGHEGNIKQVYPFTTHPYALVSVVGLELLLGLGSPKQEWKPLPQSSRTSPKLLSGVTAVEHHEVPNQEAQTHNRDGDGH